MKEYSPKKSLNYIIKKGITKPIDSYLCNLAVNNKFNKNSLRIQRDCSWIKNVDPPGYIETTRCEFIEKYIPNKYKRFSRRFAGEIYLKEKSKPLKIPLKHKFREFKDKHYQTFEIIDLVGDLLKDLALVSFVGLSLYTTTRTFCPHQHSSNNIPKKEIKKTKLSFFDKYHIFLALSTGTNNPEKIYYQLEYLQSSKTNKKKLEEKVKN